MVLRHGEELAVSEALRVGPVIRLRFPQNHADLLELVHLAGAWEEWLERVQLRHDATEREDIDGVVVGTAAEDVLRGAVPSR